MVVHGRGLKSSVHFPRKIRLIEFIETKDVKEAVRKLKEYTENLGFKEIRDGELHWTDLDDKIKEIFGEKLC